MNNLRKFSTLEDYEEAELVKPAVSLIASDDSVFFDQKEAEPEAFGGLTVIYNIEDASNEVTLFNGGGGGSSESESESGGGGAMPTRMIVDGVDEAVINTWRFDTNGEHTVQYEFADNAIPAGFFTSNSLITNVTVGDDIESIADSDADHDGAFKSCQNLTSVQIGNGCGSIGDYAFEYCTSLDNVEIGSACNSIGNYAFQGCSTLSVFIIEAVTPPSIGYDILANTANDLVIYVPSGAGSTYESLWADYASKIQENV